MEGLTRKGTAAGISLFFLLKYLKISIPPILLCFLLSYAYFLDVMQKGNKFGKNGVLDFIATRKNFSFVYDIEAS